MLARASSPVLRAAAGLSRRAALAPCPLPRAMASKPQQQAHHAPDFLPPEAWAAGTAPLPAGAEGYLVTLKDLRGPWVARTAAEAVDTLTRAWSALNPGICPPLFTPHSIPGAPGALFVSQSARGGGGVTKGPHCPSQRVSVSLADRRALPRAL